MPQRHSGIKALRQNRRRRMENLDIKTTLRKTIKTFLASAEAKNVEEATTNLKTVYKKLDKAAKRNILEKNTASRRKARFARVLASINK